MLLFSMVLGLGQGCLKDEDCPWSHWTAWGEGSIVNRRGTEKLVLFPCIEPGRRDGEQTRSLRR